jgi:putative acetyltransferase
VTEDNFKFRPATRSDGDAIRHLVFTVLVEHGLMPDPEGIDADLADIEGSYFRAGGLFDVLVDSRHKVIGTVGLFPLGPGRCELRKMYLAAAFRGQGLGRRLLEHAIAQARELGFMRIELETAYVLTTAMKLYESFGFQPFIPAHMSARCDRAYFLDL